MLVAEHVTKRFAGRPAISGLDLRVEQGEIVCLLGANGAGKSTTISLFLGFLVPDEGTVRVGGRDPATDPVARRAMAYIPESVALYPDLSGIENLAFFDRLTGERRADAELRERLVAAGLDASALDAPIGTYSKGMRQKVGLAIALARDAAALLLDEPLSGLDPVAARDFSDRVCALRSDGHAVLMATHDIFRAKDVADRIGIMRAGRLVEMLDPGGLSAGDIERIYLAHMQGAPEVAA